jgi:hypothetical protein
MPIPCKVLYLHQMISICHFQSTKNWQSNNEPCTVSIQFVSFKNIGFISPYGPMSERGRRDRMVVGFTSSHVEFPNGTKITKCWGLSKHEGSCYIYVICVCLHIVVSNTYCVVYLFCFSSSCSHLLWIVQFLLAFRSYLTFIWINSCGKGQAKYCQHFATVVVSVVSVVICRL